MRYRLLASYQGAPFEAGVGPEETGVVLFAACPPPEVLGFEPATGHWRKQVDRADVQNLYESRPVGTFRGERCVVLDEMTDRLHIAYLGHDAFLAEQLGYWEVDRGVFELITPRQEVTEIVEQRMPVAAPGEAASPPRGHSSEQANGSRPHLPPPDALAGPERLAQGLHAPGDYLQGLPQYPGPAAAGGLHPPAADDAPLPLEAEAMRAARKAKKDQHPQAAGQAPDAAPDAAAESAVHAGPHAAGPQPESRRGPQQGPGPGSPPVPSTPAGLSEPSSVLPSRTDSAASVPSWSPQPQHVPAQRPSHAGTTEPGRAPRAADLPVAQPAAPQTVAPQTVAPQPVAPQPVAPQTVAPQPVPPQPAAPPVRDEAAVHGVPLPAPTAPAAPATARQAPAAQASAPYAASAEGQPPAPGQPAAPGRSAPDGPPAAVQPAGMSLRRGPEPPSGPTAHGSTSISNSPEGGDAPPAGGPAVAGSQLNGAYHGGHVTVGQGLPRDQFERPLPGPAAGSQAGHAGLGVAVADPVLTVPYAPAAAGESRSEPAEPEEAGDQPASRRRRASRRRMPTQRIFSELAAQAGIQASAYAINEDVDGAMCLVRTGDGFEVFNSLAGARHEVRVFGDEESAYFYLFGVLAAEAVRTGVLGPVR
jgi:hypothetical protein